MTSMRAVGFGRVCRVVWTMAMLAPLVARGQAAGTNPPSAASILAGMKTTYTQARSYRDEGQVTTTLIRDKERQSVVRPFSTAFIRPDRFRFEFTANQDAGDIRQRFVVWTSQGPDHASRWWTLRPNVQQGRIELWLAGGRTLSGGASLAVPKLLLPDAIKSPGMIELKQPRRTGIEAVDGVACHVLQDEGVGADEAFTVWVGVADSLVRRCLRSSKLGEFRSEDMTSFRPQLNVAIPDDLFGSP